MVKSAYIHIPFCGSKCRYCSFTSFTDLGLVDQYLNALKTEILHRYRGETLDTLYFGGGTPSLVDLSKIIELFNPADDAEITIEANPEFPVKGLISEIFSKFCLGK